MEDSPITIGSDSPLKLNSADPWVKNNDFEIMPPKTDLAVTGVEVMVAGGAPQAVTFSGQKCEVDVEYGDITVSVTSEANGRRLRLRTKPRRLDDDFAVSADGRTYTSKQAAGSITHVQVRQNSHASLDLEPVASSVRVTVHYQ